MRMPFLTRQMIVPLLTALSAIVAMFSPVLLFDRSLAMRDAAHFYRPLFEWCAGEWTAGRVPLWNPQENCGVPVLADASSSLFYPGKLIFWLPIDFAARYNLYVVGHLLLAAIGSYTLARFWKASAGAAAFAALAYACGGSVLFQYCNVVFLIGAAWLPFAMAAIETMQSARSWRAALALGVVLALMILGGDPQMAYHVLLLAGIYLLLRTWSRDLPSGESPVVINADPMKFTRGERLRTLAVGACLCILAAGTAALLAAIQILPSAEATHYSERAAFNRPRNIYEAASVAAQPAATAQPLKESKRESIVRGLFGTAEPGSHHDLAFDFSIGPWRLAEYFWPNVGGKMFPTHRRWMSLLPAEGRAWTPSLYLGLLPILLALSAMRIRRGSVRERWLSVIAILFTLASFGMYGVGWLAQEVHHWLAGRESQPLAIGDPVGGLYWLMVTLLPTYVYFRYPAKLLPLAALALSQLGAIGLDRATAEPRPRTATALKWFAMASAFVAFVWWCLGPRVLGSIVRADSSLGPFDAAGSHRDVLFALVQGAAVAAAALWLLKQAWRDGENANRWRNWLVGLTAVELVVANAWLVATAPADLWRNESPIATAIRADAPRVTAAAAPPPKLYRGNLAGWRPSSFRLARSNSRSEQLVRWEHETLFPKYHLTGGLSLIESYGSIKLLDYESLLFVAKQHGPAQSDKTALPQPTALRLLGTQYLVLPRAHEPAFAEEMLPDQTVRETWPEDARLWKMKRTLPSAWIMHQVQTMPCLPRPARIEAADERAKTVLFPEHKARDFRVSAVVEADTALPAEMRAAADGTSREYADSCEITEYGPQRVTVMAELEAAGLLVLGDAWFPGWQATVTTDEATSHVPIYRTNRVLRGVWLPAGRHTVDFRFLPQSFSRGALLSGIALAALALTLGLDWRGRRYRGP